MTGNSDPKIAGLLLAAGGSSRLGRPKQLVEFEGRTLIRRATEALIEAGCSPVVVVLGAEIERSRVELEDLDIDVVENNDWVTGMSSSIRVGIDGLLGIEPNLDAVLISLCDQPCVSADKLRSFLDAFRTTHLSIIAADYDGVQGVPALFSSGLIPALKTLKGDRGARDLIRRHTDIALIDLPEAAFDIDQGSDQ